MESIPSQKLRGHQSPVLCMDYQHPMSSAAAALLVSGATDECRVWDLRCCPHRAALCIRHPSRGDVLSVVFGGGDDIDAAPVDPRSAETSSPASSAAAFARNGSVYAAVGHQVFEHDLRMANSPIISCTEEEEEEEGDDKCILSATDEINQVVLSSDGQLLAAGDDTGHIQIHDRRAHETTKSFCHGVESLVTAVAFRPAAAAVNSSKRNKRRRLHLVSGGTDCTVRLWDATTATTSTHQQQQEQLQSVHIPNTASGTNQICNPPMVHTLAYSPSGKMLAAGLGDGSLALFEDPLRWTSRLEDAHNGSVASVLFPQWWENSDDRLLCSGGGNDGTIVLWDLLGQTTAQCGDASVDPRIRLDCFDGHEECNDDDDFLSSPRQLLCIHHKTKMNWITSSSSRSGAQKQEAMLFVADTSHDITAYTIPTT